jgi:hypothetical protein
MGEFGQWVIDDRVDCYGFVLAGRSALFLTELSNPAQHSKSMEFVCDL